MRASSDVWLDVDKGNRQFIKEYIQVLVVTILAFLNEFKNI